MTAWWRDSVVYQVYPRSFADSTGDGVGDLPGITAHLPYLRDLGVDALWLSPTYPSPMADAGYDVANYRDVAALFGTLTDMDDLLARAHELGLKVLLDLVPNHTSDEHAWFQAALAAGPDSPERARYLFRTGRGEHGELPPNNWHSAFGGPAWTRVPDGDGHPGQWYLHLFDARQPDLNWENPQVREEFHAVLRFWLDRGVDGFRVDVAHGLVKADGLPDDDPALVALPSTERHECGVPAPMWDQDGVHEIYRGWRTVVDEYDSPERVLCAEAWVWPLERFLRYLRPDELHQAFAFEFLRTPWQAGPLRAEVLRLLAGTAAVGTAPTWVLSNHDVVRHATRLGYPAGTVLPHGIRAQDEQPDAALGLRRARAATTLMLALPGSAYLYQGEELGLAEHTTMPDEVRADPTFHRTGGQVAGRDGCRVPMPWRADAPAYGFSPTGRSWLPQPPTYRELAADRQAGVAGSTLELYRTLLAGRRRHALGTGTLTELPGYGPDVVAFRVAGSAPVAVLVNLGAEPVELPAGELLAGSGELVEGRLGQDCAAWVLVEG